MTNQQIAKKLLGLKQDIDEAKTEKARMQGRLQSLTDELKKHGCKTVKQAQTKIKSLRKELASKEENLTEGFEELQKEYGFE